MNKLKGKKEKKLMDQSIKWKKYNYKISRKMRECFKPQDEMTFFT